MNGTNLSSFLLSRGPLDAGSKIGIHLLLDSSPERPVKCFVFSESPPLFFGICFFESQYVDNPMAAKVEGWNTSFIKFGRFYPKAHTGQDICRGSNKDIKRLNVRLETRYDLDAGGSRTNDPDPLPFQTNR